MFGKVYMIFFLLLQLALLSCGDSGKKEDTNPLQKSTSQPCLDIQEKTEALESILATEDFQIFLHPEIADRLPVRIMKTDFITNDLKIISNGQPVEVVDSATELVHRIRIDTSGCEEKLLRFSIFYPVESAHIAGFAKKEENAWGAVVTGVGEID